MSDKKQRILLVDDEPNMIKVVGKRLEVSGFEVSMAIDGEEALSKARAENPDLIVLDLMLPVKNGFEVCKALKQDPNTRKIPIIIFSGKGEEMGLDKEKCLDNGADSYVAKLDGGVPSLMKQVQILLSKELN